jgi:hypothetical protein
LKVGDASKRDVRFLTVFEDKQLVSVWLVHRRRADGEDGLLSSGEVMNSELSFKNFIAKLDDARPLFGDEVQAHLPLSAVVIALVALFKQRQQRRRTKYHDASSATSSAVFAQTTPRRS